MSKMKKFILVKISAVFSSSSHCTSIDIYRMYKAFRLQNFGLFSYKAFRLRNEKFRLFEGDKI